MKKLWSIFTNDMDTCYKTGYTVGIERHHIFEGRQGFKKKSEEYGFIVPLYKGIHPNGAFLEDPQWMRLDHELKKACQEYYLEHYGTREDWYREFGRFYDFEYEEKQ